MVRGDPSGPQLQQQDREGWAKGVQRVGGFKWGGFKWGEGGGPRAPYLGEGRGWLRARGGCKRRGEERKVLAGGGQWGESIFGQGWPAKAQGGILKGGGSGGGGPGGYYGMEAGSLAGLVWR